MRNEQPVSELDGRTQQAIAEVQDAITRRYPTATFAIERAADDPRSLHLIAMTDVDDPDEVGDLVIDRIVALQVDEGIPLHVIPLRLPERIPVPFDVRRATQVGSATLPDDLRP